MKVTGIEMRPEEERYIETKYVHLELRLFLLFPIPSCKFLTRIDFCALAFTRNS